MAPIPVMHLVNQKTCTLLIWSENYRRFQNYAATTDKILCVQFAVDFRQSNMISAFWVFYSEKIAFQINCNKSFTTNEIFRSYWIEIKRIQVNFLFEWRQSIASNKAVNFVYGGLIVLKTAVTGM